jgi:hypothetical protein
MDRQRRSAKHAQIQLCDSVIRNPRRLSDPRRRLQFYPMALSVIEGQGIYFESLALRNRQARR